MDEKNSNQALQEQNQEQNIEEETTQGAKDGANLAKNAASGNYLGAAKDAMNLAKNKTVRRAIIVHNIMNILTPILAIILIASIVLGIFNAAGDAIQTAFEKVVDFLKIEPHKNDGIIEITDEAIDEIIKSIEDLGISLDDLHLMGDKADYNDPDVEEKNKEALRKYIRKFYEAQMVTQTLYTTPSWVEEKWDTIVSGKTYGTVYVQRSIEGDKDLSNVKQLDYISYEEMQQKKDAKDANIKDYFSIDDDGKLVVAATTTTITNGTENKPFIDLLHIDYKSVISPYTTSMNFFIYLTIITQNPEFSAAVSDLVKDSEIRITLLDKVNKINTREERNYTVNTRTMEKVEHQTYDAWDTEKQYPYTTYTYEPSYGEPEQRTEILESETTTITPVPKVTYAKTWFSEQTIEYIKKPTPIDEPAYPTEPINEKEPEITQAEGSVSWITNDITTITKSGEESEYEESTRGDVVDRTGEKGDGKKSFVGLLDVPFKIPNSKIKESAGINLVSGAEMFFGLLQKDANSQNLENIMRYILYKYTGNSYGVTTLDHLSVFDIKDFTDISGTGTGIGGGTRNGGIEEVIKSYENDALRKYMNGELADYSSVSKYVTQDKTQYKMYYTSFDGCLNFSYGIMVRSKAGTLNNTAYFAEEGLDLQSLVAQYNDGQEVLVEVEKLDRIFRRLVQDKKKVIKNELEKRGASLKNNEIDALVNLAYQYGNCGQYISGENNIANLYNKYYITGQEETFKQKAVVQTQNGGYANAFTGEYAERKKYNWILFTEGRYILSDGTEISAGILAGSSEVSEFALQFIGENHSRFTSYNPPNGVPDIWYGANWCAMFVSYCYNECGLIPDVLQEPYCRMRYRGRKA